MAETEELKFNDLSQMTKRLTVLLGVTIIFFKLQSPKILIFTE